MTTPDAEAVAALAEALHEASPWPHRPGPDSAHCTNGSSHGERAEALAAALRAGGWAIVRTEERDALVERMAEMRHDLACVGRWASCTITDVHREQARAAIEGRL